MYDLVFLGAELAKDLSTITLLDVYKAVNVVQEKELFSIHENPNPNCPVGRNIQNTIGPLFSIVDGIGESSRKCNH